MKSQQEIKDEIFAIENSYKIQPSLLENEKQKRKDNKRLVFLRTCQMYLESEPTEDFINAEILSLSAKIKSYDKTYADWFKSTPGTESMSNPRSSYNSQMGITLMKQQIASLNYLLKN